MISPRPRIFTRTPLIKKLVLKDMGIHIKAFTLGLHPNQRVDPEHHKNCTQLYLIRDRITNRRMVRIS